MTRRPPARALDLEPNTPVMLVFGGSQAVRRLNRAVWSALLDLVKTSQVIHMTGQSRIRRRAQDA